MDTLVIRLSEDSEIGDLFEAVFALEKAKTISEVQESASIILDHLRYTVTEKFSRIVNSEINETAKDIRDERIRSQGGLA